MNKLSILILFISAVFCSCSRSDHEDPPIENDQEIVIKPFNEGIIEMGIFSHDIELGRFIDKIDYSKGDVKTQYENLLKNDVDSKAIFDLIQNMQQQNPLAALTMLFNITQCTYHIKNDVVLGKVKGLGWSMDNFLDQGNDMGSIYSETLTQNQNIPVEDRNIYGTYQPSKELGSAAINTIDLDLYERSIQNKKQLVSGYLCDVVTYTLKQADPNSPISLHKLVVYTSPLFSTIINFAHPYYLEETGGILKLDIHLDEKNVPTLVMKPKQIKEKHITAHDLRSRTSTPIYSITDLNWAIKSLAIMMSGWG